MSSNCVISMSREPSHEKVLRRYNIVRDAMRKLRFEGQKGQLQQKTLHWAFQLYEPFHVQLTTDGVTNNLVDHWHTYCPVIRKYEFHPDIGLTAFTHRFGRM